MKTQNIILRFPVNGGYLKAVGTTGFTVTKDPSKATKFTSPQAIDAFLADNGIFWPMIQEAPSIKVGSFSVATEGDVEIDPGFLTALENMYLAFNPHREVVAAVAEQFGYAAYTGGRHVSLHDKDTDSRLAVITGTTPDWI